LVTTVTQADGRAVVDVLTAPERAEAARYCPDCGVRAAVKETVTTTPRDVYLGDRQILLRWRKRRWECQNQDCERKTFTESLPAVPPRARLTSRPRTRLAEAVGDDLMPAAGAARRYGVSDRTAARAFTAYANAQLAGLDEKQEPAQAAGIDEFRRGAPASTCATCSPCAPPAPTSPPPPARCATSSPASTWWCADHHDVPEVKSLAETISKWQQPVIDAVLTGYSKAEAHNRTAKMVARVARGFANPGNQGRRVRMATTRAARQAPQRRPRRRSRKVARAP
jgi:transposase